MARRRARGEGSVIERGDGRWVARLTLRDGTRRERYLPTAEAARAALAAMLDERRAGVVGSNASLGGFLAVWLDDIRPTVAPATFKQHSSIVTLHLVPALGKVKLSDLTVADVRRYLHRSKLHPQTVSHHRATLRRALADAVREGLVMRNVAALAQPPSVPDRERAYLTVAEVRALLAATKGDRLHALWAVGATCGLRLAEALALTWDDIDQDAGSLTVRGTLHRIPKAPAGTDPWYIGEPKTRGSRRTVPLTPLGVAALKAHALIQAEEQMARGMASKKGTGMVFTTERGQPVHGPNVLPRLKAALVAAGLQPVTDTRCRVTYHGLRHSAASVMLEAGIPLRVVSELLGHSTIRITADLYGHVAPTLAREAADRLQAVLEPVEVSAKVSAG